MEEDLCMNVQYSIQYISTSCVEINTKENYVYKGYLLLEDSE